MFYGFTVFDLEKKIINLKISFRLTYLSLKISIFLIKSFPSEIKNEIHFLVFVKQQASNQNLLNLARVLSPRPPQPICIMSTPQVG